MELTELLALLGLPEDATEEQIRAATKKEPAPSLSEVVPRSEYDALRARTERLEASAKAREEEQHKNEVEREIRGALQAGKITPASANFYRKTCATRQGLEDFREFLTSQAEIAPDTSRALKAESGESTSGGVPPHAMQLCQQMGLNPEIFAETYAELKEQGLIT